MIDELYLNKANRDSRYKELKTQGKDVRRSSIRGQLLHPQYIEDFNGDEKYQTGLGNTVYKTFFSVLYSVRERLR